MKINIPSPLHQITLEKFRSLLVCFILCAYLIFSLAITHVFGNRLLKQVVNGFIYVRPIAMSGVSDISDFTLIYASGLLNWQRFTKYHDIDIYDPFLLTQNVTRAIAPMHPIEIYSIQYPPMLFLLTTPLAQLNLYNAWLLWSIGTSFCVAITLFVLICNFIKERPYLLVSVVPCFGNIPFLHNFIIGQSTPIELAVIAISFKLMLNSSYFWAGFVAGASLFKIQFAPIILIPGICVGKSKFLYGCILMALIEAMLSIYTVGWGNVLNFVKANYLCEVARSYIGLNDIWSMSNFRSILAGLPWTIPNITLISSAAYIIVCLISFVLWLRVYPKLKKISNYAFELIASVTITLQVIFSMHLYYYDYILMSIPAIWLYLWSTINDTNYSGALKLIRFFITILVILLPLISWLSSLTTLSESTLLLNALRPFLACGALVCLTALAIILQLKNTKNLHSL